MYTAEKEMKSKIDQVQDKHSKNQITFDMVVEAKYTIYKNNDIANKIKSHLTNGKDEDIEAVYTILKDNEDPRKTQCVNYKAYNFKADGESLTEDPISPSNPPKEDKWIK